MTTETLPTPVSGLFEAHLTVADLPRSVAFYRDEVGLPVALEIPERGAAPARLEARGIQPLSFFGQPTSEPWVIGWMPAATLYFRDPDVHMLEYLTMLDQPARPDAGVVARSEWR